MPKPRLSPHALAALKKPAKAPKVHAADLNTIERIKGAVGFRACIFRGHRGPGLKPFDTQPYATLREAREALGNNPRSVIYAVTPEGYTIHVPASYKED